MPGTVRFGCPHCEQGYFGTDAAGLLVPKSFQCVGCSAAIDIDEMVLNPAGGVDEAATVAAPHPWFERKRVGLWRGFWRTVGYGMSQPTRLARLMPPKGGVRGSVWFAMVVQLFPCVLVMVLGVIAVLMSPRLSVFGILAGFAVGFSALILAYVLAWVGLAHAVLVMTGKTAHTIGRTCASIGITAGPMIIAAIPCLGAYAAPVGLIWWGAAAGIVVARVQRVSWWRATLAGAIGPLFLIVGVGGVYGVLIYQALSKARVTATTTIQGGLSGPGTMTVQGGGAAARKVADALRQYAAEHDGQRVRHAAELIAEGLLAPPDFIAPGSTRDIDTTPLGTTTLGQFWVSGLDEQRRAVDAAVGGIGKDDAGYWIGDCYICDREVSLDPGASPSSVNIWLVVSIARTADGSKPARVYAAMPGGAIEIPSDEWLLKRTEQNDLRRSLGLPELPDLLSR